MNLRGYASIAVCFWMLAGLRLLAEERYQLTGELDSETWLVAQLQPSEESVRGPATDATRGPTSRATRSSASSSYARLARAPNMFGDSFGSGGQLSENQFVFFVPQGGTVPVACDCGTGDFIDLPGVGGGVLKVAENNKPVPMDRMYFVYNGFQNALTVGTPVPRDVNFYRYTLGLEKTFHDGLWSVNVGMPFNNSLALESNSYTSNSDSIGNLAVFLKRLLYADDSVAVSLGFGMSLPTGSDLVVETHQFNPIRAQDDVGNLVIRNEAIHLIPYIGFLDTASDLWFFQGFLSLNFAASGNPVELGSPPMHVGTLTEQHLLHIDLSAGRWLMQNPEAYYLTGIAAIAEMHLTTTIHETDSITLPTQPDTGTFVNGELTNPADETDIVNFTVGFQMQIGQLSNLRVGYVLPLRERPYREFDSELQVSFNRSF